MAATAQTVAIQQKLNAAGFNLAIDGIMGPKTKAALTAYQKAQGLPATGSVDQATVSALLKPVAVPKPAMRPPGVALGSGQPPQPGMPMPNMRPAPVSLAEGSPNNMPRMRNLTLPPLPYGGQGPPNFSQPQPEPPQPQGPPPGGLGASGGPSGAPDDASSLAGLGLSPDIIRQIMLQKQMQTSNMGQPYSGGQQAMQAALKRPVSPLSKEANYGMPFQSRVNLDSTQYARTQEANDRWRTPTDQGGMGQHGLLPEVKLPMEKPIGEPLPPLSGKPFFGVPSSQSGTSLVSNGSAPAFDRFDATPITRQQPPPQAGGYGLPGMPSRDSFQGAMGDVMGAIGNAIIPSVKGGEAAPQQPDMNDPAVRDAVNKLIEKMIWDALISQRVAAPPSPVGNLPPAPPSKLQSPMGAYR